MVIDRRSRSGSSADRGKRRGPSCQDGPVSLERGPIRLDGSGLHGVLGSPTGGDVSRDPRKADERARAQAGPYSGAFAREQARVHGRRRRHEWQSGQH